MAVSKVEIAPPSTRRSGRNFFQIGRQRPIKIFVLTKLTGDTTYNLDTGMESAHEIIILDAAGAVIAAATGSVGFGGNATFTSALAALGAGLLVFVIVIGNRITR